MLSHIWPFLLVLLFVFGGGIVRSIFRAFTSRVTTAITSAGGAGFDAELSQLMQLEARVVAAAQTGNRVELADALTFVSEISKTAFTAPLAAAARPEAVAPNSAAELFAAIAARTLDVSAPATVVPKKRGKKSVPTAARESGPNPLGDVLAALPPLKRMHAHAALPALAPSPPLPLLSPRAR